MKVTANHKISNIPPIASQLRYPEILWDKLMEKNRSMFFKVTEGSTPREYHNFRQALYARARVKKKKIILHKEEGGLRLWVR